MLLLPALVVGGAVAAIDLPRGDEATSTDTFLAERFDLEVSPDSVHLLGDGGILSLGRREAVFLASRPQEPRDLYRASVRVAPGGRMISAGRLVNLTRTSAGDEDVLVVSGSRVATRTRVADQVTAVTLVDLGGESREVTRGRSAFWRLLWGVRNSIEFGSRRGVDRHSYQLLEPAADASIELEGARLAIAFDGQRATTGTSWNLVSGEDHVEHIAPAAVQTALVPFAVDTVRLLPWFGPHGIAWMEHVFFAGLDLGRRGLERVGASSIDAEEMAHEMGAAGEPGGGDEAPAAGDQPSIGFPPADLRPIRDDPIDGEGVWRPMADPRFVRLNPGAPPAFATTFLRPDQERGYARTAIVVWDPRQVEIYPVAGTFEPMSATGVRGTGMVPRDQVERMVAGFNGGFQVTHGEYGMMMEGTLFIPPKGYGATVATMADGRTGLGTWSEEVDVIPPSIVAFRQNMTALVQDGAINPYERDWWGAAPQGARDPTYTQRSGICLTEEGFIAYLWGPSLSPESLGAAMLATRCVHGVHLDMNAVLTGFEFYHVAPTAELPALERPLDEPFEGAGTVPERPELSFRARRLARPMEHMNFPRYICRDTRDFFWLKLRRVLPGDPLAPPIAAKQPGEGVFSTEGLYTPAGAFPPAVARAFIRPDPARPEGRVDLVRIDPMVVRGAAGRAGTPWPETGPGGQATKAGPLVAIVVGVGAQVSEGVVPAGERAVALVGSETVRPAAADARAVAEAALPSMVAVAGPALQGASRATLAVAPDGEGFLVVAHEPGGDPSLLASALSLAGAAPESAVVIGADDSADVVFVGGGGQAASTLSGRPAPEAGSAAALVLLDAHQPQGVRLFPAVPVVRPGRWQRFLNKREVYLRSSDGQYRHVTGMELPHSAPMVLKNPRPRATPPPDDAPPRPGPRRKRR